MEVFKELQVQVVFSTVRDKKGRLIQGQVMFNTAKAEHLVKTCIAKGVAIPRIFMSRDGTGCPTMINELDSHNYHSPLFSNEIELEAYTKRCLDHLAKECIALDSKLFLIKSGTTASVQTEEVDMALEDKSEMQLDADVQAEIAMEEQALEEMQTKEAEGIYEPTPMEDDVDDSVNLLWQIKDEIEEDMETDNDDTLPF